MSFLNFSPVPTRIVQYLPNQSSPPALSNNTDIVWDTTTKRTTGGDLVSINASTGVITLSSSRRYWLQASIQVDRASAGDFAFEWQDGSGNTLGAGDGAFSAIYLEDYVQPLVNSSLLASVMVSSPSLTYKLVCTQVPNSSSLNENTELLIWEFER